MTDSTTTQTAPEAVKTATPAQEVERVLTELYGDAKAAGRAVVVRRQGILAVVAFVVGGGLNAVGITVTQGTAAHIVQAVGVVLAIATFLAGSPWVQSATTPASPTLKPTDSYGRRMVAIETAAEVAAQVLQGAQVETLPTSAAVPAASDGSVTTDGAHAAG